MSQFEKIFTNYILCESRIINTLLITFNVLQIINYFSIIKHPMSIPGYFQVEFSQNLIVVHLELLWDSAND